MYKIGSWGFDIEEVEVIRVSEKSVFFIRNNKEKRESSYNYYETWEKAKQAIVDRCEKAKDLAYSQYQYKLKQYADSLEIKH